MIESRVTRRSSARLGSVLVGEVRILEFPGFGGQVASAVEGDANVYAHE
jgi:hypothetical protein